MITAVDSSVVFDIISVDAAHFNVSRRALAESAQAGTIVACESVWAEVSAYFPGADQARSTFDGLLIAFDPMSHPAALEAGRAWRAYRARRGPRNRVVPDFLIGAHALMQADRLLTRDAAFQRRNFPDLAVFDPTDGA